MKNEENLTQFRSIIPTAICEMKMELFLSKSRELDKIKASVPAIVVRTMRRG